MKKPINLQDAILDEISQHKIPVTVFLMNGFQIRGLVVGYDSFVVLLEADGNHQMLYKHAISTLIPRNPVSRTSITISHKYSRNNTPSMVIYFTITFQWGTHVNKFTTNFDIWT